MAVGGEAVLCVLWAIFMRVTALLRNTVEDTYSLYSLEQRRAAHHGDTI